MFKWLFGKRPKSKSSETIRPLLQSKNVLQRKANPPKAAIDVVLEGWLSIPMIDFYGAYSSSPNGKYRIAWRDGQEAGNGRYVLIRGEEIVCNGDLERPQDGKVADNGVFILNDWRAKGPMTGKFMAFRPDGTKLIGQSYEANLYNNGLSADGQFAACQTCNSNDEKDSAVLTVFDLTAGKEIHRFRAESGWPNTYRFSPEDETVTLGYSNGKGEFTYKFDGTFIDRDAWISRGLERGDLILIRRAFDETGGKPDPMVVAQLLDAADRGLADAHWQEDGWQATGLRLRGEILEAMGQIDRAIESYEKALKLNPKIGIKRRVGQLRKSAPLPKPGP